MSDDRNSLSTILVRCVGRSNEGHGSLEAGAEVREELMLRQIRSRVGIRVAPFMAGVADDADDFAPVDVVNFSA